MFDQIEYAVHYTNFADFISIVKSGRLYSRSLAEGRATFSHNTALTGKVMADTDEEIKNYARLALSDINSAFYHFQNRHGKNFVICQMRFGLDKIYKLPRLRLSEGREDRAASKLKFTRELPRLDYMDFLERIRDAQQFKMAEILVYGEVPLFCLDEVVILYIDTPPDLGEIENILADNGTVVTMRKK